MTVQGGQFPVAGIKDPGPHRTGWETSEGYTNSMATVESSVQQVRIVWIRQQL